MKTKKDKSIIILTIIYWLIPVIAGVFSFITWNFIGLSILLLGYFVSWLVRVHGRLHMRLFDLEFDNKQNIKRIIDLEDERIYWRQEQKESQQKSFVYGTTKLSNPEVTKELVNEIAETNSKRTLFDDLWKIEPPVKKK